MASACRFLTRQLFFFFPSGHERLLTFVLHVPWHDVCNRPEDRLDRKTIITTLEETNKLAAMLNSGREGGRGGGIAGALFGRRRGSGARGEGRNGGSAESEAAASSAEAARANRGTTIDDKSAVARLGQ